MTDPRARQRLVDLSVLAVSALTLGGSVALIAEVEQTRPGAGAAAEAPAVVRVSRAAPVPGLVRAPAPPPRRVVVRRSRAS